MKTIAALFALSVLCIFVHAEDLHLASDGSLHSINVVTNIFTPDFLANSEKDALTKITKNYETIAAANKASAEATQNIANLNALLTDIRRYQVTLEALKKMKDTGTNVVHVPITLPAAKPSTNAPGNVDVPPKNIPLSEDVESIGDQPVK